MKDLIKSLLLRHGYLLTKNHIGNDPIVSDEFGEIFNQVKEYSGVSLARHYALYKAVEYIIKNNIPGDFVECGVAGGGSVMNIALALQKFGVTDRTIYLYDTFTGMTRPSSLDHQLTNSSKEVLKKWQKRRHSTHVDWLYFPLEQVKQNMALTNYPEERIVYVKGPVEETIPKLIPRSIALLRLDTDFYSSTKHELEHLYPLLTKQGVLLVDDYGVWAGSKKAVDEYFVDQSILLNRIDRDGRIGIKAV